MIFFLLGFAVTLSTAALLNVFAMIYLMGKLCAEAVTDIEGMFGEALGFLDRCMDVL